MNIRKYIFIILTAICQNTFGQIVNLNLIKSEIKADDNSVSEFLAWTKSEDFISYEKALNKEYKDGDWNDWFLFKISQSLFELNFPEKGEGTKALSCWYILNKEGRDVRLVFSDNSILLFVRPQEKVYGSLARSIGGTKYVCLNSNISNMKNSRDSKFILNENGSAFTFAINKYPQFLNEVVSIELGFLDSVFHHKFIVFPIKIDLKLNEYLYDYPNLEYDKLFNTPLSPSVYNSLIPQLSASLVDIDTVDRIEFLFNFVNYGFLPQSDIVSFGKDKWLTPDESIRDDVDSEDKAGLFYFLVKELLNIPILCFYCSEKDNVIVGVSLDDYQVKGAYIYKGLSYKFFDPYNSPSFEEVVVSKDCRLVVEYFPTKGE